jgi:hypothetical protein
MTPSLTLITSLWFFCSSVIHFFGFALFLLCENTTALYGLRKKNERDDRITPTIQHAKSKKKEKRSMDFFLLSRSHNL